MKLQAVEVISLVLCLTSVRLSGASNQGPVHVIATAGSNIPDKYYMTQEDVEASNNGVSRMEYLRRFIGTGIDRMPILDPYQKDLIEPVIFNQNNSLLYGTVNLRNLVSAGAKQYSLRNLEIRLQNNRLDVEVYIPEINAEVDFDATDFIYDNFEISFSGHLSATLRGYVVKGAISVVVDEDNKASVGGLNVNNLIDDFTVEVTQHNVPRTIPQVVVDEVIQQVANSVASTAVDEVNNVLAAVTYEQLLDFLLVKRLY